MGKKNKQDPRVWIILSARLSMEFPMASNHWYVVPQKKKTADPYKQPNP
jgi:hypothetical protein